MATSSLSELEVALREARWKEKALKGQIRKLRYRGGGQMIHSIMNPPKCVVHTVCAVIAVTQGCIRNGFLFLLHWFQYFRGIANVAEEEQVMAELRVGDIWLGLTVEENIAYATSMEKPYVNARNRAFKFLAEHRTKRLVMDENVRNRHVPSSRHVFQALQDAYQCIQKHSSG